MTFVVAHVETVLDQPRHPGTGPQRCREAVGFRAFEKESLQLRELHLAQQRLAAGTPSLRQTGCAAFAVLTHPAAHGLLRRFDSPRRSTHTLMGPLIMISLTSESSRALSKPGRNGLSSDFDFRPRGLNLVGLRRAGIAEDEIGRLKKAYFLLFRSGLEVEEALRRIEGEVASEHTKHLVEFVRASKRGICRHLLRR